MRTALPVRSPSVAVMLIFYICLIHSVATFGQPDQRTINFPKKIDVVEKLPSKKNLWIFFLVGQSNMAGRGFVEAQDTLADNRVLTVTKNNEWIYAKEPLHYYEPALTGLDCGLSFGKALVHHLDDSITIAVVPCAVGGSAIHQWLGDSLFRNVRLLSNFKSKVDFVKNYGTIKGILWHQGESDAHPELAESYAKNLSALVDVFRDYVGNKNLPVLMGNLGNFTNENNQRYRKMINKSIDKVAASHKNVAVISTRDLAHKGDHLHFNSASQRIMGERFAAKFLTCCK